MDDVSDDVWSTQPVAIINSTEPIERTMDDGSTRLQREHNYTLKVTIITDYANVTSTTDFSEREGGREEELVILSIIFFYRYTPS